MQIEMRKTNEIRPYPGNPRVIPDEAVAAIASSIKQFGWRQPLVVDEVGEIIIGHGRHLAAQKLGLAEIPVHVARNLSPEQIKALRIADNKSSELSDWNMELLPIELSALQDSDYDLSSIGFSTEDLAQLLNPGIKDGLTYPDAVPAPPDEAVSKRGEIYILGNHRLMCGDSADPADVDKLLAGAPIHLVVTDPPYGVAAKSRSNNAIAAGLSSLSPSVLSDAHPHDIDPDNPSEKAMPAKLRAKDRPIINDAVSEEEFAKLLRAWFGNIARVLIPGGNFYLWGGYSNCASYPSAMKECELYFSQAIIWVKKHPVMSRKNYMGNHEWAFFGWRSGAAHRWFGPHNDTDVWEVKKVPPQRMIHLTEKPVELALKALMNSSQAGEHVLDMFGGSGSTLIGCEQAGRRCFMMELDELYCDVIRRRWAEFTSGEGCDWEKLTPVA